MRPQVTASPRTSCFMAARGGYSSQHAADTRTCPCAYERNALRISQCGVAQAHKTALDEVVGEPLVVENSEGLSE